VIAAFWTASWDLRGQSPHVTELLGDPSVHFAFEEGESQPGNRLVGVWTELWRRKLEGRGSVRAVKLRSGAIRAFTDVPAFQFTNRILSLDVVFGRETAALERTVLAPGSDEHAFDRLENALRARRLPASENVALAVELAERIAKEPAIVTVARLARTSGLSPRALQRLFRSHVGASPKWLIRRHRLQEAALRLERGDCISLAALAAELGYTDQAHLAHDFKTAVGRSPSEFAISVHR
jgi:AraC-like DNA-binding protein